MNAPAPTADPVLNALRAGAVLAVSVSGGKDSQALLAACLGHPDRPNWTGPIVAVHADLGRAEWRETEAFVRAMCERAGVPLHVVAREGGDLFARFEERAAKLAGEGKPWAPSAANRYCTSDLKRSPIDKFLRAFAQANGTNLVVSAEGVRAAESAARSKKPRAEVRVKLTTKTLADAVAALAPKTAVEHEAAAAAAWAAFDPQGGRLAFTWRPIFEHTDAQVWEACGTSVGELETRRALYAQGDAAAALEGWPAHPAYVYGNARLSCALCILGCRSDLVNGARHNPDAVRFLVGLEGRTGFTFLSGVSLRDVAADAGVAIPLPVL